MISICFAKNKYYNEEMEKFTRKLVESKDYSTAKQTEYDKNSLSDRPNYWLTNQKGQSRPKGRTDRKTHSLYGHIKTKREICLDSNPKIKPV